MIIVINGSLGVGKTTIADNLLWKFNNTVMLDGDAIGNVNPFEIYDQKRILHLYRTLTLLTKFHKENGFDNIVINYVFESSESLDELINMLRMYDKEIYIYWITCNKEIQEERILTRKRDNIEWELQRFVELQEIQRHASTKGFIGVEIDSSHKTVEEISDKIVEEINLTTAST